MLRCLEGNKYEIKLENRKFASRKKRKNVCSFHIILRIMTLLTELCVKLENFVFTKEVKH